MYGLGVIVNEWREKIKGVGGWGVEKIYIIIIYDQILRFIVM